MPSYALALLGLCAFVAVAAVKVMDARPASPEPEPPRAMPVVVGAEAGEETEEGPADGAMPSRRAPAEDGRDVRALPEDGMAILLPPPVEEPPLPH